MKKYRFFFTFIILNLFAINNLTAGWIIVEKKLTPQGLSTHDTIYVQNNKMRSGGKEASYIYDLNRNRVSIINNFYKTYWTGTPEEYRLGVIEGLKEEIDVMVAKFPKEKQKEARENFEAVLMVFDTNDGNPKPEDKVSYKKIVDKTKVLGYETQRYDFYLKGEKKITIWVSPKIDISKDLDMDKYTKFMLKMMNNNPNLSIKTAPEYAKLIKNAYPLRTIEYLGSQEIVGEVVLVENKRLPESLFTVNQSFRQLTLPELIRSIRKKN